MAKLLSKLMNGSMKKILLRALVITMVTSIFAFCPVNSYASYEQGNDGWFFYFLWTNDKGTVNFKNQAMNRYTVSWNNNGAQDFNFTCGKGWQYGSNNRIVTYSGSFNPGNNGYLALYGWTKLPEGSPYKVAEYYVIESYGNWTPPGSGAEYLGTVNSDGGEYKIYRTVRINQPWILGGNGDFYQYWSIRTQKKPTGNNLSGVITFENHVKAWEKAGLTVGEFSHYYQVMETEGYGSSGNSDITVGFIININILTDWSDGNRVMYIDSNKEMKPSTTAKPTDNNAIYEMHYVDFEYVNWNNWKRWIPIVALKSKSTGQYVTVVNDTDRVKANSNTISTAQKFYFQDNYGYCDFQSLYNDKSIDFSGICRGYYANFDLVYLND